MRKEVENFDSQYMSESEKIFSYNNTKRIGYMYIYKSEEQRNGVMRAKYNGLLVFSGSGLLISRPSSYQSDS